jgi:hypothetical protein
MPRESVDPLEGFSDDDRKFAVEMQKQIVSIYEWKVWVNTWLTKNAVVMLLEQNDSTNGGLTWKNSPITELNKLRMATYAHTILEIQNQVIQTTRGHAEKMGDEVIDSIHDGPITYSELDAIARQYSELDETGRPKLQTTESYRAYLRLAEIDRMRMEAMMNEIHRSWRDLLRAQGSEWRLPKNPSEDWSEEWQLMDEAQLYAFWNQQVMHKIQRIYRSHKNLNVTSH